MSVVSSSYCQHLNKLITQCIYENENDEAVCLKTIEDIVSKQVGKGWKSFSISSAKLAISKGLVLVFHLLIGVYRIAVFDENDSGELLDLFNSLCSLGNKYDFAAVGLLIQVYGAKVLSKEFRGSYPLHRLCRAATDVPIDDSFKFSNYLLRSYKIKFEIGMNIVHDPVASPPASVLNWKSEIAQLISTVNSSKEFSLIPLQTYDADRFVAVCCAITDFVKRGASISVVDEHGQNPLDCWMHNFLDDDSRRYEGVAVLLGSSAYFLKLFREMMLKRQLESTKKEMLNATRSNGLKAAIELQNIEAVRVLTKEKGVGDITMFNCVGVQNARDSNTMCKIIDILVQAGMKPNPVFHLQQDAKVSVLTWLYIGISNAREKGDKAKLVAVWNEVFDYLLQKHFQEYYDLFPISPNTFHYPLFHYAVFFLDVLLVQKILHADEVRAGTVLAAAYAGGKTILHSLVSGIQYAYNKLSDDSPFISASIVDACEICSALLQAGARVDLPDDSKMLPWMYAAEHEYMRPVELMLRPQCASASGNGGVEAGDPSNELGGTTEAQIGALVQTDMDCAERTFDSHACDKEESGCVTLGCYNSEEVPVPDAIVGPVIPLPLTVRAHSSISDMEKVLPSPMAVVAQSPDDEIAVIQVKSRRMAELRKELHELHVTILQSVFELDNTTDQVNSQIAIVNIHQDKVMAARAELERNQKNQSKLRQQVETIQSQLPLLINRKQELVQPPLQDVSDEVVYVNPPSIEESIAMWSVQLAECRRLLHDTQQKVLTDLKHYDACCDELNANRAMMLISQKKKKTMKQHVAKLYEGQSSLKQQLLVLQVQINGTGTMEVSSPAINHPDRISAPVSTVSVSRNTVSAHANVVTPEEAVKPVYPKATLKRSLSNSGIRPSLQQVTTSKRVCDNSTSASVWFQDADTLPEANTGLRCFSEYYSQVLKLAHPDMYYHEILRMTREAWNALPLSEKAMYESKNSIHSESIYI